MGGYRDIHPWPYHWERKIAPDIISDLTLVNAIYPRADYWTYNNHVSLGEFPDPTPKDRIVDIYWSTEDDERLQMPLEVGDHICEILLWEIEDKIRLIIWFRAWWRPAHGWTEYAGPQGDFVDHLHVEFNPLPDDD